LKIFRVATIDQVILATNPAEEPPSLAKHKNSERVLGSSLELEKVLIRFQTFLKDWQNAQKIVLKSTKWQQINILFIFNLIKIAITAATANR